jgi:transposase-like protein
MSAPPLNFHQAVYGVRQKVGSRVGLADSGSMIEQDSFKRLTLRAVYLNNIVEQDHRAIKRRTRPMLGFKDFRCARILLSGIELMHMIRKGQMKNNSRGQTPAQQFYSLAA